MLLNIVRPVMMFSTSLTFALVGLVLLFAAGDWFGLGNSLPALAFLLKALAVPTILMCGCLFLYAAGAWRGQRHEILADLSSD